MPKGFTGIRLLLVFVAINTILFLMLVTSMTSGQPWLGRFLPGHFGRGGDFSGYWVFFSLVLLVNALTVLVAGFVMVLPAILDGPMDERRLRQLFAARGIDKDATEACLAAVREETAHTHRQIAVGRGILIAGAVFLVLAFVGVTLSLAHALPGGSMFAQDGHPVVNAAIDASSIWLYAADQVAGALLLDIPEIYALKLSPLINNIENSLYTDFIFVFRAVIGGVGLATVVTLIRGYRARAPQVKPAAAESIVQEKEA